MDEPARVTVTMLDVKAFQQANGWKREYSERSLGWASSPATSPDFALFICRDRPALTVPAHAPQVPLPHKSVPTDVYRNCGEPVVRQLHSPGTRCIQIILACGQHRHLPGGGMSIFLSTCCCFRVVSLNRSRHLACRSATDDRGEHNHSRAVRADEGPHAACLHLCTYPRHPYLYSTTSFASFCISELKLNGLRLATSARGRRREQDHRRNRAHLHVYLHR